MKSELYNKLQDEYIKILFSDTSSLQKEIAKAMVSKSSTKLLNLGIHGNEQGVYLHPDFITVIGKRDPNPHIALHSKVVLWIRSKKTRDITEFIHRYTVDTLAKSDCKISCKSGCGDCCHQRIIATSEEAKLLKGFLGEDIHSYRQDFEKLTRLDWEHASFEEKRCPFLKNSMCSVYAVRPIVCRKHVVISDPVFCIVDESRRKNITIPEISLLISAYFSEYEQLDLEKALISDN
jgi:Fe-S-cluster containining protein